MLAEVDIRAKAHAATSAAAIGKIRMPTVSNVNALNITTNAVSVHAALMAAV
ncbi:hypothetical protein [Nocardioides sp. MH1]|uniref:hypothetical protein n=1 Tax=Nocardioides sp. MH1 TaxID=3242490 RepID=UPI00351FECE7